MRFPASVPAALRAFDQRRRATALCLLVRTLALVAAPALFDHRSGQRAVGQGPTAPASSTARRGGRVPENLAAAAAPALNQMNGSAGVVLYQPGRGVLYQSNPDRPYALASVTKLYIMTTLLAQTEEAGRGLTDEERDLLDAMIASSDNDAADVL